MTKDGLVERNETTGANTNISKRAAELDLRNDSSEGDVQDVGIEAARSMRVSYSQVGNKPSESTRKRNKAAYRQHKPSNQERENAVPQTEPPHGQHEPPAQSVQPTQATAAQQSEIKATAPQGKPITAKQNTAAATPKQEQPPPITSDLPRPRDPTPDTHSNQPNPQGQQPDGGKLKTQRDIPYRHEKPSALQTSTQSALQNKPTSAQALKHRKDTPEVKGQAADKLKPIRRKLIIPNEQGTDDTAHKQPQNADGTEIQTPFATEHSTDNGMDGDTVSGTPGERETYSQVGNKQNKLRDKRNANPLRQSKLAPVQHKPPNSKSRLVHREDSAAAPAQSAQGNTQSAKLKKAAQKKAAVKAVTDINAKKPQAPGKVTDTPDTATDPATVNRSASDGTPKPPAPNSQKPQKPSDTQNTALKPDTDSQLQPDKGSRLKFTEGETAPTPKSRGLVKAEKGVERANSKLNKARDNLPAKRKLSSRLVFDEEKGKSKREFFIEKQTKTQAEHLKTPLPFRPVKAGANSALNFGHSKIFQVEHENVEIKAAHRGEMAAEGGVRGALRHRKAKKYVKVAKLEQRAMKKNVNLAYRQALEKNPKLKSNVISRMWQKRKIRKQYAKAARDAKRTAGGIKKAGSLAVRAAKTAVRVVLKNPKVLAVLLVIGLVISMVMVLLNLGMALGSGGMGALVVSSYLAEDTDITDASVLFTELELDLIEEIENIPLNHPGFDEYRINIDLSLIRHNPFELIAYLTAVHLDFSGTDIAAHLQSLFAEQYQLVFTPTIEIRFTEDEYGNPVPYDWHVLTVTMINRPFSEVIQERMTAEQQLHFTVLMETLGNRQQIASPFDFNWLPHVSSHFGYRIHPINGGRQFHGGIDIALPTGTPIRAGHGGIVTFAGYNTGGFGNLVIIDSGDGLVTKYAHCHTLNVSTGQQVAAGDVIATVGSTGQSTGPHLHMEVLINGQRFNPAFLVATQP
jgi:hypothetical protein